VNAPWDEPATIGKDEDPFGPYEFVEVDDRCAGAEGLCGWERCTQRESTCRCCCPTCAGDDLDTWGYDGPH
jgi:hypothetical protein